MSICCFFVLSSLCAWALEELHVCEEFAEWSERALEPWYETQLVPDQSDVPKSHEVADREVRLVYKALHKLPNLRGAYVISLFEGKDAEGGLIVRAFDRAKRDAFWLSLSKNKIASLGGNAAQSPATLAAALSLRLKMKLDFVSSTKRLVLPSAKKVESSSDKKKRDRFSRRETKSVSGASERDGDGAGEEKTGVTSRESDDVEASPSPPSTEDEPVTTAPECPAQTLSQPRRSHPPPTRGSKSGDLGPLVEKDADGSECSAEDFKDTRSASSSSDVKSSAASTVEVVPKENSVRNRTFTFRRAGHNDFAGDRAGSAGGFGWRGRGNTHPERGDFSERGEYARLTDRIDHERHTRNVEFHEIPPNKICNR